MTATKIFMHKRYTLFRSFGTKGEAQKQAKIIRSEGRSARVSQEDIAYLGQPRVMRWAVWVHR